MLEKPADSGVPIHDLIRRRWSPRAFADRMVEREKLHSLFEAARWAASSYNEQPWRFIVCTKDNPADHERFVRCLADGNIPWARHAPVLALSVARTRFTHNDRPNRHALHDVGLAVGNLLLQATALGLAVHQMAGYDAAKARAAFGIPDDYEPVAAIAMGYQGDPDRLPPPLRDRETAPRTRKPLDEIVFGGRWAGPPALLQGH
jgi:nitroreductase